MDTHNIKKTLNEIASQLESTAKLVSAIWNIVEANEAKERGETTKQSYKGSIIRQRPNGVYELRYRKNGYNKSFYSVLLPEVKSKFDTWLKSIDMNSQSKAISKNITVAEWVNIWLDTYKKPYVSERTFQDITMKVNKYVVKKIGDKPLKSVSSMDIQKLLNEATYNGRPQNKVYTYTKSIFKVAMQNNLIKNNPAEFAIFKKTKDKNSKTLTAEEQKAFLQAINGHELENYYTFMLYSGCRRAEALEITKDDIKNGYIHIKGTKTELADRYIPYFEELQEVVKKIDSHLLFPFPPHKVSRHFAKFAPNHTLRDLRKTFATTCHEKGVSPKVVQKWLGHSKLDMTMNVYTEVTKDFEQSELSKLSTPKT